MGYVPLFDSLVTGTLHGRWPDIGLWPVLLSLANRFGDIDVTANYIASVTGLDLKEVEACIERFCAPDRHSRSLTDDGRRLVLLDPERAWGWHVVNHAQYRERARLTARDAARTASGEDAARKRAKRESPPLSPASPELPPSDSNAYSDSDKIKKENQRTPLRVDGVDPEAWEAWVSYRRERRLLLSHRALNIHAKLLRRYSATMQREIVEASIGSGWTGLFAPKGRPTNGSLEPSTTRSAVPTTRSAEMDRAFEEGVRRAQERDR